VFRLDRPGCLWFRFRFVTGFSLGRWLADRSVCLNTFFCWPVIRTTSRSSVFPYASSCVFLPLPLFALHHCSASLSRATTPGQHWSALHFKAEDRRWFLASSSCFSLCHLTFSTSRPPRRPLLAPPTHCADNSLCWGFRPVLGRTCALQAPPPPSLSSLFPPPPPPPKYFFVYYIFISLLQQPREYRKPGALTDSVYPHHSRPSLGSAQGVARGARRLSRQRRRQSGGT